MQHVDSYQNVIDNYLMHSAIAIIIVISNMLIDNAMIIDLELVDIRIN